MTKNSKHKLLFITLFLTILMASGSCAVPILKAYASEPTINQKGVNVLSNVAGLDLTKYSLTTVTYNNDTSASYFGIPSGQKVQLNLSAKTTRLNVLCTFTNGTLQMLQVLDSVGTQILAKPEITDTIGLAKNFLSNYQTYTADSFYGQLESTLNDLETNKNITQKSGDIELDVTTLSNGYTVFKWTYEKNGIVAPTKFLALGYKNNSLSFFVDNWQVYKIGSTTVTVSKDQAEAIALKTAESHSWSVPLDNNDSSRNRFNQSSIAFSTLLFSYSNYPDKTHNGDPLMLYPIWRVGVQLDRWYGDLYGMEVTMYADTGRVISAEEAFSTLHPQTSITQTNMTDAVDSYIAKGSKSNSLSAFQAPLPWVLLFSIAIVGAVSIWLVTKRLQLYRRRITDHVIQSIIKPSGLRKCRKSIVGIFICTLLLSFLVFFISAPTVKANPNTATAVIWGSESEGQLSGQQQPYNYWRKTLSEIIFQQQCAIGVSNSFHSANWPGPNGLSTNQQGEIGSYWWTIENQLSYLKNHNAVNVAVVDFDHGVGTFAYSEDPGIFHYMQEDETGNYIGDYPGIYQPWRAVYDNDIYTRINPG